MKKYKILYHWTGGDVDEDDNYGEFYETEEIANDEGNYGLYCRKEGAEILFMSNPGDNPYSEEDFEDDYFEVIEVDV